MKNTVLLSKLEKVATKVDVANAPELTDLINELKAEIYAESNGSVNKSLLQRTKAALKYLKNNTIRQVLQYCDYQKIDDIEYQVFTDSYTMFMLVDRLELPYWKDNMPDSSYPDMLRIYNSSQYDTDITEIINIPDIMQQLKAKMIPVDENKVAKYIVNYNDIKIGFDVQKLKSIVDILGTTDLKVYYRKALAPLLFVDEKTGNKALLCPIRV